MIPYYGTPITPNSACLAAIQGGHALVSYHRPDQLAMVIDVTQSFMIDNGAFSAWKSGEPITDWADYYKMVEHAARFPNFDFAVVPDVINGTEQQNDELLARWPFDRFHSAPVWHLDGSLERLDRLLTEYPRICIGSAGQYAHIGDARWWERINEVMGVICNSDGFPRRKVHGLRMLRAEIISRLPLASADSSHIGRSVGLDVKWTGSYAPTTRDVRALVLRTRTESIVSPRRWDAQPVQESLFLF